MALFRPLEAPPARPSSAAYAIASIELYSRLWLELERLIESLAAPNDSDSWRELETRVVVLRLELVLLLDACDSPRWQSMLGTKHRLELRATLEGLLITLSVPPDALGFSVIAGAQNGVLGVVLTQWVDGVSPGIGQRCCQARGAVGPSIWAQNPETPPNPC